MLVDRRAYCAHELIKVLPGDEGGVVEGGNSDGVPGAGDKSKGVDSGLRGGVWWIVGKDEE